MSDYTLKPVLTGFSDSVNAGGRIGASAAAFVVDFGKIASGVNGFVKDDTVKIGELPANCNVTDIAVQVVSPLVFKNNEGTTETKLLIINNTTTMSTINLHGKNAIAEGAVFGAVTAPNGASGKNAVKLVIKGGDIKDDNGGQADGILSGVILVIIYAQYMPEPDELTALWSRKDEVSDGGIDGATPIIGVGYDE